MKQFEYCRCYYIEEEIRTNNGSDYGRVCKIATGKSNKMKIEYYIPDDQILFHELEDYLEKYKNDKKSLDIRTNKMIAKLYFSDGKELVIYDKRRIEILGALGKDGWELITASTGSEKDAYIADYILKRELTI